MSATIPAAISTTMPMAGRLELVAAFVARFDGTAVGERRRWPETFKAEAVAAALKPGANVFALARRLGLTAPQLFGWRKPHLDRQRRSVRSSVANSPPVLELVIGDVTLRIGHDVSEATLRKIIRVMRLACACSRLT